MSDGWGDEKSCDRCGHPSGYHGVTFCICEVGAAVKRMCDCPGWKARISSPQPQIVLQHGLQAETESP